MQPQVAYLLLIVGTLVLLGATGGYAWRHRRSPGGLRFALFVGAAGAWVFLTGAMAMTEPSVARLLLSVKYLAIGAASTASFLFIAQRTGHLTRLGRARTSGFFVVPAIGCLASLSDRAGMIRDVVFGRAYSLTHVASISFGPVYWLFTGYLYALVLFSVAFLFLSRRDGGQLQRTQATPMLFGVLAPFAANILLITGIAPRAFDPMPFGIAVSALCLWWGAYHGRILDLVPAARHVLIDSLHEGILIVGRHGRILDLNTAFARLARVTPNSLVGLTLEECDLPVAGMHDVLRMALASSPVTGTATDATASAPRLDLEVDASVFDVRVIAVDGRDASAEARIVVLQDVTERQRWQDEQARLIAELQAALGQVKTLTGLLPICADCKQIRDGAGQWHSLEVYIRQRTDAEFTHGMCPTCVDRWYPEFAEPSESPR
jgi:hypothetical protein